jgi:transcription initiation factor TFIIB
MEKTDDQLFDSDIFINKKIEGCCDINTNIIVNPDKSDSNFICNVCGRNISSISDSPEWRFYGADDNKSSDPTRCGPPLNSFLPKSSIGTSVSSYSNRCDNNTNKVRRFQTWNSMTYKERSLNEVYKYITTVCTLNNINNIIINEAKSLYSLVATTKISRGKNRSGIIVASVFFACKNCDVPRSDKELSKIFELDNKDVTNGIKKFREILRTNRDYNNRLKNNKSIQPEELIDRYCNKLNISDTKSILNICNIAKKYELIHENTPPSIAAGCIYYYILNNDLNISKNDIHKVCEISEVTINKCYKKIAEKINKKVDEYVEIVNEIVNEIVDEIVDKIVDNVVDKVD